MTVDIKILHTLIDEVAQKQGDRTALIYYPPGRLEPDYFSYRQYIEGVNRLINWLRALGIGEGDAVGYLVPDSPTLAMLACAIQSSAIALELDIWARPDQVLSVIEEAKPRLIVCANDGLNPGLVETYQFIEKALAGKIKIVVIDIEALASTSLRFSCDRFCAADFPPTLDRPLNPDLDRDIFYRLTGGTTGRPKVVPQSARKLLASILIVHPFQELSPDSVLLMAFTTFYIYYMPCGGQFLIRGIDVLAGLVTPPGENLLIRHRVTDISLTPNFIAVLAGRADMLEAASHHPIKVAATGGRLFPGHYQQLKEIGIRRVFNYYGATETGLVGLQEIRCEQDVGRFERIRDGHQIKIVDSDGNELPAGEIGELAIRGEDVYVGRFLKNGRTGDGWHLMGDLAKIDSRGRLVVMGRDFRGMRVSSTTNFLDGELLESVLTEDPAIQFASIIVLESIASLPCIGIFVCPAEGATISEAEVIGLFREKTSSYEIAAEIKVFMLGSLPMTPRGKVDRMRLTRALVEHRFMTMLQALIPDEGLNVTASDDEDRLFLITIGRADKMPMDAALGKRILDLFPVSPYPVQVV